MLLVYRELLNAQTSSINANLKTTKDTTLRFNKIVTNLIRTFG